jgi:hypothetical protein
MFAALVIFAFACLAVRADVVIQIIRDDNKLPLANAKVVIEPIDKDGKIIDQGRTDAKGAVAVASKKQRRKRPWAGLAPHNWG